MVLDDYILFLGNMLPYVNSGLIILDINILLMRFNLRISLSEYKKKPIESLILGIFLRNQSKVSFWAYFSYS